jgi:16S rRNA (guanine527-N7)-methyltransferase
MGALYERHVLHSLSVARVCRFDAGARVLDVGCGGGFPGIPLAIMFPEAQFTLCDSIGKKIRVVRAVAESLGLDNVTAVNGRAEAIEDRFDYVVSRAVADMSTLMEWVVGKIEQGGAGSLPSGMLCLKGGDLAQELAATGKRFTIYDLSDFFEEEFFATKKIVYFERKL